MLNEPASAPDNDRTLVPTPSSVTAIFATLSAAPFSGVEVSWFASAREGAAFVSVIKFGWVRFGTFVDPPQQRFSTRLSCAFGRRSRFRPASAHHRDERGLSPKGLRAWSTPARM